MINSEKVRAKSLINDILNMDCLGFNQLQVNKNK